VCRNYVKNENKSNFPCQNEIKNIYLHNKKKITVKTKLLRKVRKKFEINYYPNGYDFGDYETNNECVAVINKSVWFGSPIVDHPFFISNDTSKDEAYKKCYELLVEFIMWYYASKGTRRNKKLEKTTEKFWYSTK
jgi:hypothetical protein